MRLPKQSANVNRDFSEIRYGTIVSLADKGRVTPSSCTGGGPPACFTGFPCGCGGRWTCCQDWQQCYCWNGRPECW